MAANNSRYRHHTVSKQQLTLRASKKLRINGFGHPIILT